jgi:hypothetical protein
LSLYLQILLVGLGNVLRRQTPHVVPVQKDGHPSLPGAIPIYMIKQPLETPAASQAAEERRERLTLNDGVFFDAKC